MKRSVFALLAICGRVVLVAGLLGCGSSSSSPPDAGDGSGVDGPVGDLGDLGVHDAGRDTPPGATLIFSVNTREVGGRLPMPAVSVTCDRPNGTRQEETTDGQGEATFGELDWSAGTASCTAYAPGYALHSVVGLTRGGAHVIYLEPLDGTLIDVSGQAIDAAAGAPGLLVSSDVHRSTFEQDAADYLLQVPKSKAFKLVGARFKSESAPSPRELRRTIVAWAKAAHKGSGSDVTVDLDFTTSPAATTFTATLVWPAGSSALATASRAEVWVSSQQAPSAIWGTTTRTTLGSGEFALEGEYIDAGSSTPITRYSLTLGDDGASHRWFKGAPQSGARIDSFLPLPKVVTPADVQVPVQPRGAIGWATIDGTIVPSVELRRDGALLWRLVAPAGASSLNLPVPPDAIAPSTFFGDDPSSARVVHSGECDAPSELCGRRAESAGFLVQAAPPATITVTGTLTDFATQQPLAGALICVPEAPNAPCVTSDASGAFAFAGVPNLGTIVNIDVTKVGYIAAALARGPEQQDNHYVFEMFPLSTLTTLGTKLGVAIDNSRGLILIEAPAGSTLALTPTGGVGPAYADGTGLPAAGQTSVGARGWAWFANLPAGNYELEATGSGGGSCSVVHGWPGANPSTAHVEASVDTLFVMRFACP